MHGLCLAAASLATLAAVRGLIAVASPAVDHRVSRCLGVSGCGSWALGSVGSVVVTQGLCCPEACGIEPWPGIN